MLRKKKKKHYIKTKLKNYSTDVNDDITNTMYDKQSYNDKKKNKKWNGKKKK